MEIAIDTQSESIQPQFETVTGSHMRVEKFVSFQLGEHTYAINAAAVAEVTHPLPIIPLPNQPRGLAGISPMRGDIVASVDLRGLLGESRAQSQKTKQIVLKPAAEGAAPISFLVDRLGEISSVDLGSIRRSQSGEFIYGEIDLDERVLRIVNHSNLASAIDPER